MKMLKQDVLFTVLFYYPTYLIRSI